MTQAGKAVPRHLLRDKTEDCMGFWSDSAQMFFLCDVMNFVDSGLKDAYHDLHLQPVRVLFSFHSI